MKFKLTAALTAVALAAASLAPTTALARDHGRGGYGGYHGGRYYDHGRHWGHNDDAVAAGVVGLVLGLALGAAASDNRDRRCYDRCGNYRSDYRSDYYGPPPQYGYAPPPPQYRGYQNESGCIQQAQQWDPYAGRYVWVNVRVPC